MVHIYSPPHPPFIFVDRCHLIRVVDLLTNCRSTLNKVEVSTAAVMRWDELVRSRYGPDAEKAEHSFGLQCAELARISLWASEASEAVEASDGQSAEYMETAVGAAQMAHTFGPWGTQRSNTNANTLLVCREIAHPFNLVCRYI